MTSFLFSKTNLCFDWNDNTLSEISVGQKNFACNRNGVTSILRCNSFPIHNSLDFLKTVKYAEIAAVIYI